MENVFYFTTVMRWSMLLRLVSHMGKLLMLKMFKTLSNLILKQNERCFLFNVSGFVRLMWDIKIITSFYDFNLIDNWFYFSYHLQIPSSSRFYGWSYMKYSCLMRKINSYNKSTSTHSVDVLHLFHSIIHLIMFLMNLVMSDCERLIWRAMTCTFILMFTF